MMSDYPQSPQVLPPMMAQTSTLAIVSLIAGIVSWVLVPFIGAVVAVITGHMAKKEIRQSAGSLTGDGLATAGLVLGYIQLGLTVLAICCIAILFVTGTISIPFLLNKQYL
jgi:hypothetical protein